MTTYAFEYNDGNAGNIEIYQSINEALDAAEVMWDHLSKNDKRRYTDESQGACFCVCEMDGEELGICLKDFTNEVRMKWRDVMDHAFNLYIEGVGAGDEDLLIAKYGYSEENAVRICEAIMEIEEGGE